MSAHVTNPSPSAVETGREERPEPRNQGRFQRGNRGGPGNPFNRQIAAFRQRITQVITVEDIDRILNDLLAMAAERNLAAMKLLLQYTIGKPHTAIDPDRVDVDEWKLCAESTVDGDAAREVLMDGLPVRTATEYAGLMEEVKIENLKKELVEGEARRAEDAAFAAQEEEEYERGVEETRRAYREEQARRQAEGNASESNAPRPMTSEEIIALLSANGLNGEHRHEGPTPNGDIGDEGDPTRPSDVKRRRPERMSA